MRLVVLPDDQVSGREGAAGRQHGCEGQTKSARQALQAGGVPLVSEGLEDRFPHRILLRSEACTAQPFCDVLSAHATPASSSLPLRSSLTAVGPCYSAS